ncbi:hypothetical protein Tco_0988295 [Tanacetum coccineum]|uniref:Uncharacterized protein n=1 Tax=Tanacetum coccineum TaxID=301880 RepID=A0ABQ5EQI2_9ASTR
MSGFQRVEFLTLLVLSGSKLKDNSSSTTKVDCEPPNGSNECITNPYECDQTLNVSAGTLNLSADQHPCFMIMASVDNTSGPVPQRKERCTLQCALSSKEEKSSCILKKDQIDNLLERKKVNEELRKFIGGRLYEGDLRLRQKNHMILSYDVFSHSEHAEYDESNTYVLERFNTTAGNPVKKILLKLNLSDHRLFKDGGGVKEFQRSFRHSDTERLSRSDEVLKLKNFKKDATLKLFKSTNQKTIDEEHSIKRENNRRVNDRVMQSKEGKVDSRTALDAGLVVTESNETESERHVSSSRSGKDTHAEDADINSVNDKQPLAEGLEMVVFHCGSWWTVTIAWQREGVFGSLDPKTITNPSSSPS